MSGFKLEKQPSYPLHIIDTDQPISEKLLSEKFDDKNNNIMLLIRSENGHEKRGGFFFSLKREPNSNVYTLETIDGNTIADFNQKDLIRFINHVAGLKFDPEMLSYCQNTINLLSD